MKKIFYETENYSIQAEFDKDEKILLKAGMSYPDIYMPDYVEEFFDAEIYDWEKIKITKIYNLNHPIHIWEIQEFLEWLKKQDNEKYDFIWENEIFNENKTNWINLYDYRKHNFAAVDIKGDNSTNIKNIVFISRNEISDYEKSSRYLILKIMKEEI